MTTTAARLASAALLLGLAAALWGSTVATLGFALSSLSPAAAMRAAPHSEPALSAAAGLALNTSKTPADFAHGSALARAAAARSPLSASALGNVALFLDQRGDRAGALAAMNQAARLSLHDYAVHSWLFDRAIERGDFTAAAREADVMLRQRDDVRGFLTPVLVANLDAYPGFVAPFARLLRTAPPWRSAVYQDVSMRARLDTVEALFAATRTAGDRIGELEMAPYFVRAAATRPPAALLAKWRELTRRDRAGELLRAGGFEEAGGPAPFGWTIFQPPGTLAEIGPAPSRSGRALTFSFGQTLAPVATQSAVLEPGTYQLRGSVFTDQDHNGPSASVWLRCGLDERGALLLDAALPSEAGRWRPFALSFTVPKGCDGQKFWLGGRDGTVLDPGRFWIDDISIVVQSRLAPSSVATGGSAQ